MPLCLGELSLDGAVRYVNGVLPMAYTAQAQGYEAIFVPQADAPEAALVEGIKVYPVDPLSRLAAHLRDYHPIEPNQVSLDLETDPPVYAVDKSDLRGSISD